MVATTTETKEPAGAHVLPVIWEEGELGLLPFRLRWGRTETGLPVVWDEVRPALRRRARRVAWPAHR